MKGMPKPKMPKAPPMPKGKMEGKTGGKMKGKMGGKKGGCSCGH